MSVDAFMAKLQAGVKSTLEDFASEVEQDLRERVGTTSPIASKPGESPHKGNGGYQAAFTHSVTVTGDALEMNVENPTPLANWLEHGTSRMAARPHFRPCFDAWSPRLSPRIAQSVQTEFT